MADHQQTDHQDHEYLLLDWEHNGILIEGVLTADEDSSGSGNNTPESDVTAQQGIRRQPKPTNQLTTSSFHSKSNINPRPKPPPLLPNESEESSTSETIAKFYDLRAIHNLSPHEDLDFVPQEIIELHVKHAKEKNGKNPDELPEVWKAPPPPELTVDDEGDVDPNDDVEMVSRAPDYNDDESTNNDICRSIQGKYGERSSKNPGIILRYQYELIQDLEGIDWTINAEGERDGTEYLTENVVPALEQGIGDVLVRALFEECGGGMRRLRWGEGRGLKSTVVGLDGEPADFPLGQGECISTYTPINPLQSYQCHTMEGSVTLYFPPNYSYPTVLDAATLQILRAIKDGMESGELAKSSDKILSLLFLDKSYNLKPVFPGEEVGGDQGPIKSIQADPPNGKSNAGLIVGMVFLILIIIGLGAGGYYYKKRRDEEFAYEEQRRRDIEELNAKQMRMSSHSSSSRMHAVFESEDDGTTTSDDGDGTTTSDDGDGTTTSDDGEGTTTSDEDSTTSGSKETTTDSSDSESDSDSAGPYGNLYKKRKAQRAARKIKNNIVYSGGDEASVMTGATGATGLHSVSSQRTAKVRNVVPVIGVDINMR